MIVPKALGSGGGAYTSRKQVSTAADIHEQAREELLNFSLGICVLRFASSDKK
jgi:hypothetical protein